MRQQAWVGIENGRSRTAATLHNDGDRLTGVYIKFLPRPSMGTIQQLFGCRKLHLLTFSVITEVDQFAN